jgi:hypothetical protein
LNIEPSPFVCRFLLRVKFGNVSADGFHELFAVPFPLFTADGDLAGMTPIIGDILSDGDTPQ